MTRLSWGGAHDAHLNRSLTAVYSRAGEVANLVRSQGTLFGLAPTLHGDYLEVLSMKGRDLGHAWWLLALLLFELALCSPASAQPRVGTGFQPTPASPALRQPVGPDIAGPSVEVLGGSVITLASVPVALLVLVFKGPSLGLGCNFDLRC